MSQIRVAYIGCGAVVERSHLPALSNVESMRATVLVDFNEDQRSRLAAAYSVNHHSDSVSAMLDHFDIAVIATPSASHYSIAKELLSAGKHVLVEKPLSMHYHEAVEIVAMAKQSNLVLAVSLVRRYLPHFKLFKTLMSSNIVGEINGFHVEEGGVFNWPVQGAGFYKQAVSGGGVLMDSGAHLLDACLWWLGDYESVYYTDDSQGGVEAECNLRLTLACGATGSVAMSRLRKLANTIRVDGDRGSVCMNLGTGQIDMSFEGAELDLTGHACLPSTTGELKQAPEITTLGLFEHQYSALIDAISTKDKTQSIHLVCGDACLESIRLIEQCYANRQPLPFMVS